MIFHIRGVTPQVGMPTYYFSFFCRKLHENERNLAGGAFLATPLYPPLPFDMKSSVSRDRQAVP